MTITTLGMADNSLQPGRWLLRLSLLLFFLSTVEPLTIQKEKEILGGLGRQHVTVSQDWLIAVSTCYELSKVGRWLFFPFILMKLGKFKFFLKTTIKLAHDASEEARQLLRLM